MIDNTTKQELLDHFHTLPAGAQNLIRDLQLEQELNTIQEIKPLQEAQKIAIQNEIVLIFLGLTDIVSLTTNIRNNVQISRDRAEKISTSIQQAILTPHIDILEKIFETPEESRMKTTGDIRETSAPPQKKIEQTPLPKSPSQNIPQRPPNQPTPVKDLRPQAVQNPAPTSEAPNAFAHKLANPTLMKGEEEKVEVESHNDHKPKHVDPYREPTE